MSKFHVAVLKRARKILPRTKHEAIENLRGGDAGHLCLNIDDAASQLGYEAVDLEDALQDAAHDITSHIDALLARRPDGKFRTLERWLIDEGHLSEDYSDLHAAESDTWTEAEYKKLQRTRLAWIDWLIEYWRDK